MSGRRGRRVWTPPKPGQAARLPLGAWFFIAPVLFALITAGVDLWVGLVVTFTLIGIVLTVRVAASSGGRASPEPPNPENPVRARRTR